LFGTSLFLGIGGDYPIPNPHVSPKTCLTLVYWVGFIPKKLRLCLVLVKNVGLPSRQEKTVHFLTTSVTCMFLFSYSWELTLICWSEIPHYYRTSVVLSFSFLPHFPDISFWGTPSKLNCRQHDESLLWYRKNTFMIMEDAFWFIQFSHDVKST
jgi:hypothetical protein